MFEWLRRRRATAVRALSLRSRGESDGALRVGFAELAPDARTLVAHAAAVQECWAETATALAADRLAPWHDPVARAADLAASKHERLRSLLGASKSGADESEPFRGAVDEFRTRTAAARGEEAALTLYLAGRLLSDFGLALTDASSELPRRAARILRDDDGLDPVAQALRAAIADNDALAPLLSLWGRRLVGDTLLLARVALRPTDDPAGPSRVEPVFTELVAAHGRRMESLGLTA